MDRGARDPIVNGRFGKGVSALLLLALLLVEAGCHRGERAGPPMPPPGPEERAEAHSGDGHGWPSAEPVDNTAVDVPEAIVPAASPVPEAKGESDASPPPDGHGWASAEEGRDASRVSGPSADNAGRSVSPPSPVTAPAATSPANGTPSARKPKSVAAQHPVPTAPPMDTPDASPPGWAKSPEELVYRVDFIGITMGYARFRYQGKVSIAGKTAFHLNVRAWTSGVLSYIYPINETIDYYLDAETIAPIRQEFTQREREKDDVALYNQETGRITYRYRQSGKIRKQVDTIPCIYDPVSVAYYFRWRDMGVENRPRNVYGGRKIYQISSRVLGYERIHTEHGEVDTIAVLPLIRRDGKPDDKGNLKIWFSNDERRVPVRLYAKFHKIKDWTLVGELMSSTGKAGG
jgi:Protein of unknown function (DUF3108)